jgi:hypothetical protein
MLRLGIRTTALVLGFFGSVQAQVLLSGTSRSCAPIGWVNAAATTGASAGITMLQKRNARRADGWAMGAPVTGLGEWNDAQTPLHIIASHQLARVGARAFGGCASRTTAAWRGAAFSAAIGVAKEVVDGFYDGFNPADLVADGAGIGLAVAQAYAPRLESLSFTVSLSGLATARTPRGTRFGAPGHATWLSASPDGLLPAQIARRWPAAARVSAGRRIGQIATNPPEYVFTLDLDASRVIPLSNGTLRSLLRGVHLPAPGVIVAHGQRARFGLVW